MFSKKLYSDSFHTETILPSEDCYDVGVVEAVSSPTPDPQSGQTRRNKSPSPEEKID